MTHKRGAATSPGQAGFALIEVMVSALIAVTVTGAVIGLLNSTGHAGAEQRHHSQAYSIAQEDQARLRAKRISELGVATSPRTVTLNGTNYTVSSNSTFVTDKTGTASCSAGTATADYVKLSSTVTWPSMGTADPVVIESILSPVSGSLDPTRGTLAVYVKNEAGTAISGVGLNGSGTANFSGSTDSTGCALFAQPAGNYTLTPTLGAGYVNFDGETPPPVTTSVIAGSTTTKELQYDKAGSIPVNFKYRVEATGTFKESSADSIIVFNAKKPTGADVFGTPGGTRQTSIEATSLYPFTGADSVYAGSCTGDNPGTGNEAAASVAVPPGGKTAVQTLQLPALNLKVWTGKNSSSPGAAFNNADIWITDLNCGSLVRHAATNSSGNLPDPGLPWSKYNVCADTLTGSGTGRRQRINNVEVKNLASGTTINFYLGSGTSTVSEEGNCP